MSLRDGKITLSQLVARVEQEHSGLEYKTLEDLMPILHPTVQEKVDKNMAAAFYEDELDKKLQQQAAKRGIDMKLLQDTAKKISFLSRCTRSVYSKPAKKRSNSNATKE